MLNCPHCRQALTLHEIGVLYAAFGRKPKGNKLGGAKLTKQAVNQIRKSKEPTKKKAKKYGVSFTTIWRVENNITYKGQRELNCPHCGYELTKNEIGKLFATLGGSIASPKKVQTALANVRKLAKLTEKDVANIRKSKASNTEEAEKYKVKYLTILRVRNNKTWKNIL